MDRRVDKYNSKMVFVIDRYKKEIEGPKGRWDV